MAYFDDNPHAWRLGADGLYHRIEHGGETAVSTQHKLLGRLSGEPVRARAVATA